MSDVSSHHDEKATEKMSMDELRAELLSLTRQMSSIKDLQDPRTVKLRAFLTAEITTIRHAITKLKPVDEQISILQSALLKKKADLSDAKARKDAASAEIAELTVDINGAEAQLQEAKRRKEIADSCSYVGASITGA
eukprot:1897580-Karenia_brevis.AAC.1